ncbi:DUF4149 domain-containing protein [Allofranklinella schreckenbergeri]|uniref:DUF4149 domain-containing protein n=1 Tax=Allofranklinella schreckenbergeri TaxID=1076744 RepID=UPI001EEEC8B6|nr:DUF4149 domain-containing protein [Allofranklinella schreckenbergeri]
MPKPLACIVRRLPFFAAALWWGGLSVMGFLAVPLVFAYAPSVAVAGPITAKMFSAITWVAVACGLLLVLCLKPSLEAARTVRAEAEPAPASPALALTGWALAGVILALLIEFAVAPRIVARVDLHIWHNLGTALYVLQWLCAGVVLFKLSGRATAPCRPQA